jgi:hypothetical protein
VSRFYALTWHVYCTERTVPDKRKRMKKDEFYRNKKRNMKHESNPVPP